jgi:hypothetical protein
LTCYAAADESEVVRVPGSGRATAYEKLIAESGELASDISRVEIDGV